MTGNLTRQRKRSRVPAVPTVLLFLAVGLTGVATASETDADLQLALATGWTFLTEGDMRDTYGGFPWLGAEFSYAIGEHTRSFLGLAYGARAGDPYHATEDFSGPESHLRVVPVTMGLSYQDRLQSAFMVRYGAGFQLAWAREEYPFESVDGGDNTKSVDGWGLGFLLMLANEWRPNEGHWAVGLEVAGVVNSVDLGSRQYGHSINLMGFQGRLYVGWRP